MTGILKLSAGDLQLTVDPQAGGRVRSITADGSELLWWPKADQNEPPDPLTGGMYPMVPFAGRIRHGEFDFDDSAYQLPAFIGGHAMHGYGYVSEWDLIDDNTIGFTFADPWPFAGSATQRFEVTERAITIHMTVNAVDRQPVQMGWHPWFLRNNSAGTLTLDFAPSSMYERDGDGMPGDLIDVPDGPYDDCFIGVTRPVVLRWGALRSTLSSTADHWVLYDEPEEALCVEPQSGPPNEINSNPKVLEAGESHTESFTMAIDRETARN